MIPLAPGCSDPFDHERRPSMITSPAPSSANRVDAANFVLRLASQWLIADCWPPRSWPCSCSSLASNSPEETGTRAHRRAIATLTEIDALVW
jgi:hypothetical protein